MYNAALPRPAIYGLLRGERGHHEDGADSSGDLVDEPIGAGIVSMCADGKASKVVG